MRQNVAPLLSAMHKIHAAAAYRAYAPVCAIFYRAVQKRSICTATNQSLWKVSVMVLFGFVSSIASRFTAYRNYRRTLQALSALDDRELADLGIFRGRIEEIARGAAR